VRGSFAGSSATPASGKEASIPGRGDFRGARLHDGEVAEHGAEAVTMQEGESGSSDNAMPKRIEVGAASSKGGWGPGGTLHHFWDSLSRGEPS
jgi:hypothetical protein